MKNKKFLILGSVAFSSFVFINATIGSSIANGNGLFNYFSQLIQPKSSEVISKEISLPMKEGIDFTVKFNIQDVLYSSPQEAAQALHEINAKDYLNKEVAWIDYSQSSRPDLAVRVLAYIDQEGNKHITSNHETLESSIFTNYYQDIIYKEKPIQFIQEPQDAKLETSAYEEQYAKKRIEVLKDIFQERELPKFIESLEMEDARIENIKELSLEVSKDLQEKYTMIETLLNNKEHISTDNEEQILNLYKQNKSELKRHFLKMVETHELLITLTENELTEYFSSIEGKNNLSLIEHWHLYLTERDESNHPIESISKSEKLLERMQQEILKVSKAYQNTHFLKDVDKEYFIKNMNEELKKFKEIQNNSQLKNPLYEDFNEVGEKIINDIKNSYSSLDIVLNKTKHALIQDYKDIKETFFVIENATIEENIHYFSRKDNLIKLKTLENWKEYFEGNVPHPITNINLLQNTFLYLNENYTNSNKKVKI